MRKATLVLILLLSILNDAELKESILSQMEEEEPTLEVNQSLLRSEASRIPRNLFKISFDFSKTVFEKEVVVHAGNPQITVKLSSSCTASISMGSNSGSIQVKGGAVINEKGTKVKLSKKEINFAGKFLNLNFNTMTATLTKKLKGATSDGTIKFSFSPTKVQIAVTVTKSKGKGSCDGTVTITIKPGVNPKPSKQPAFNAQAIQKATQTVAAGGAIAVGAVILFKLVKGVAGFVTGGPFLAFAGIMS